MAGAGGQGCPALGEGEGGLWPTGAASAGNASEILREVTSVLYGAVKRQYLHNEYFAGGLGLMLVGLLANALNRYRADIFEYLARRRGVCVLHVMPDEVAFVWLQEWLCKHANKDSSQLTLQSKWENHQNDACETSGGRDKEERPRLLFIPQLLEAQTIDFQGNKVTFQVKRKIGPANGGENDLAALLQSAGGKEQLVIEGPTRGVLEALVHEAMENYFAEEAGIQKTCIKRWSSQEYFWNVVATKLARPIRSVILDCDIDSLLRDARQFLSSREWYNDRGIPHRRGYLLHGPPGCGKTSLIQVLAGELGHDVALIGLSSQNMNDDMLHAALSRCDTRNIIVLEDVDAAFTHRNDGDEKDNQLSFSGLLNAIDGFSAQEGRLLVMTTNHLDRLDPALVRPGRIDMRLYLGLASRSQSERMFLRFYPECSSVLASAFAEAVPEASVSPATLQGYFLLHRDDPEGALEHVKDLLAEQGRPEAGEDSVDQVTENSTSGEEPSGVGPVEDEG